MGSVENRRYECRKSSCITIE